MQIGEVIREYRKRKNMTQEKMAYYLGVTAPAVNKWEKGVSQPDITLLAPISRLLDITLDILLSFQEELTADEINQIVREVDDKVKNDTFENTFVYAKEKIEQYPNCKQLIWQMALILDVGLLTNDVPDSEPYERYVYDCYERALDSDDENIRTRAADSLFGFYSRKDQYEKAEEYLNYFSSQNPERKRKQALIYSKTNRVHEAYKLYEELLFSGCQMLNMVFQSIYMLAMHENDHEKARMYAEKKSQLANLFDMGKYHEVVCFLELATEEKDEQQTIETMENMINSIDQMSGFTSSKLYEHMEFKPISAEFLDGQLESILACFRDEETFGYMKDNKRWQQLISMTASDRKDSRHE